MERRRRHNRGLFVVFLTVLFTTTIIFVVAAISVNILCETAIKAKDDANNSSDIYQDIRYTLVDGKLVKEFMTEEEIAAEETLIESLNAENSAPVEDSYTPPEGEKIVYLTFDDGPSPYTEKLLDVLKKHDVKATFFVTCAHPENRSSIKRAFDEGHSIGLHTCTHNYEIAYANDDAFFEDLGTVSNIVKDLTGLDSKLIRFPGGSSNSISKLTSPEIMTRLTAEVENRGYAYFDWNVASKDTGAATDSNSVYNNITSSLRGDYSIVLQHDIKEYSVDAVERVIEFGKKYGFTFKPLTKDSPTAHHRLNN